MTEFDKTDWKILKSLFSNSRTPISTLAKEARISKAGCFYRLKRLETSGLITGYKAKINMSKLGFNTYAVYLKLFDIDQDEEKILIDALKKIGGLKWLVTSTGAWDLMLSVEAKNNLEFHEKLGEILKAGKRNILEHETAIVLSTRRLWLSDVETIPEELSESATVEEKIDLTDIKILDRLHQNARIESSVISRELGLTAEAVSYRIKNLVKRGIIHSFGLYVNLELLGLDWYQVQFLLNNPKEADIILPKIVAAGDVGYVVKTLGKWNFEVHLYCRNIQDFRIKLLKLRSLMSGSIRDYETNIILKKHT